MCFFRSDFHVEGTDNPHEMKDISCVRMYVTVWWRDNEHIPDASQLANQSKLTNQTQECNFSLSESVLMGIVMQIISRDEVTWEVRSPQQVKTLVFFQTKKREKKLL